ncbi:OpgC domain-containing protein, partial [Rhizobium ruizarguesonis]
LLVEINILAVLMNLKEGIPALLLLGHQIGYNTILPMYGALMLMVPLILLLNARSPWLALGVSGTVWPSRSSAGMPSFRFIRNARILI